MSASGDVWVLAPLLILIGGAFAVYLVARLLSHENRWLASLTALIFIISLLSLIVLNSHVQMAKHSGSALPAWGNYAVGSSGIRAERGALYLGGIALGLGACVSIYSGCYLTLDRRYKTYYPLLLLMTAGLLGMMMTADLFSLYMFCELMSISAYVLVAFRRNTDTAIEAGFKYLVMGSMGTITLLMGCALIYRETGTLALPMAMSDAPGLWVRLGLACLLVGLSIKSALVPAHTWLPDAHGRAPSSISAMLSGVVIQAALYALLKAALGVGFPPQELGLMLILLALLNMTVGNSMALVQTHTKRLLAYSTIAQMGYALFGIGVGLRYGHGAAIQAGFFMLLSHAVMKALAFLSKGICHFYIHTTLVSELRGTFKRLPLVAICFTIALVGLVGVPPLAGFSGKWFILAEVLNTGDWLVYAGIIIFLLNTLLSLGYYLPLIAALYTNPAASMPDSRIPISPWLSVPLIILSVLVIVIGVLPAPWLLWAPEALP